MPYSASGFVLLILLLASCNNRTKTGSAYMLRDSVIAKHLQLVQASDNYDTTDINYRILRAYLSNDTLFFRHLQTDIKNNRIDKHEWYDLDTCDHLLPLASMHASEVYRFVYVPPFCDYKQVYTISKRNSSVNLHFLLYQPATNTSACRVISDYNKTISHVNWSKLKEGLDKVDFWGLKKENGVSGVDGSELIVAGYADANTHRNSTATYNWIHRWSSPAFSDLIQLVAELSENKQGCFWVSKSNKRK